MDHFEHEDLVKTITEMNENIARTEEQIADMVGWLMKERLELRLQLSKATGQLREMTGCYTCAHRYTNCLDNEKIMQCQERSNWKWDGGKENG